MDEVKCDNCGRPATLIVSKDGTEEAWVCHPCKLFISWKPEIYSRVVGYLRPVSQWNDGKQEEYKDRIEYKTKSL